MSTITTVISPFTKSPSRSNPTTFSADMDSRLSEENSRIVEMNAVSSEMNIVSGEVNTNATTATTQAGISTAQAVISTAQAVISTTKAGESSTSASNALASENAAVLSESNALASENAAAASALSVDPTTLLHAVGYGGVDPVGYDATQADNKFSNSVRQTVKHASVDTNGQPNFISIGTGLAVDISATATPIKVQASGGNSSNDRTGEVTADTSISGLTASDTNYLYAEVSDLGVVTLGFSLIAPLYQFGGSYSTVADTSVFNISEMTMKVGNGATSDQAWRVFIGEAITDATTVTSVVNYALNGLYESKLHACPNLATELSVNHNIGIRPREAKVWWVNVITEGGYVAGDYMNAIVESTSAAGSSGASVFCDEKSVSHTRSNVTTYYTNKTNGVVGALTQANWNLQFYAKRGW